MRKILLLAVPALFLAACLPAAAADSLDKPDSHWCKDHPKKCEAARKKRCEEHPAECEKRKEARAKHHEKQQALRKERHDERCAQHPGMTCQPDEADEHHDVAHGDDERPAGPPR